MDVIIGEFKQHGGKTPFFSLNGKSCWGRITEIYDGDTFKVVIKLFDGFYKFNVRMYGIDTCEMKSKEEANKKKAIMARNRILELVCPYETIQLERPYTKKEIEGMLDKHVCMVWLQCLEFDKYGRLLVSASKVPDSPRNFAQVLIEEKLGYEYFGETKLNEEQQLGI